MKEKISYSQLAIDALYRASKLAQRKAEERNLKMPIWKDGKIIYIDTKEIIGQKCS